jgi:uncharacterized membrane protein
VTRYEIFKLLHVVGAIAWVGGGMGLLVLSRQMIRAHDFDGLVTMGRHGESLGTWLFMPASLLTVGFGVAMVATEPTLRFADLWILVGFGGLIGSGIAQMAVAGPAQKRFLSLMSEHGDRHPEVADAARRVTLGNVLDVGLLLLVVWAMVAKPLL